MRTESSQLLPFSKLIPLLEREYGIRLHVSTLHRWRQPGLRAHKLRCTRIGGRWLTSLDEIREFFDQLSEPSSVPKESSSRARQAQRDLEEMFRMARVTDRK